MTVMRYQSANLSVTDDTTTHRYNVESGSVDFDEAWSPYLQASVTITLPMTSAGVYGGGFGSVYGSGGAYGTSVALWDLDNAALDALDPRNELRATLVCTLYQYDEATGVLHEQNDVAASLRISKRSIDWAAGTVTVLLATDEFVLSTEANRTSSPRNYRSHQSSLIGVINACLADAGLTATLDVSSVDADVTTTTTLQNLCPNPTCAVDATGWGTSSGGWAGGAGTFTATATGGPTGISSFCRIQWTTASTGGQSFFRAGGMLSGSGTILGGVTACPITAGQEYSVKALVRSSVAYTASGVGPVGIAFFAPDGVTVLTETYCPAVALAANTWQEFSVSAVAPSGAAYMALTVRGPNAVMPLNATLDVTGCLDTEGDGMETDGVTPLVYFDGDHQPDTVHYTYGWDGAANESTSTRTPIVDRSPDSLTLTPGENYLSMLTPVVNAAGLRLFCDEDGVWRLVEGISYSLPGTVTVQPSNATGMTTTVDLTQTDIVYGSVVVKYTWVNASGNTETYYDAAGTDSPTRLVELPNRSYPGPGAAAYLLAQGQGRGLAVSTTAMTDYSARPYQAARLIAPYSATETGVVSRVSFNLASAEMDITTRGLIDTPAGAWVLAPDKTWSAVNPTTVWDAVADDFSNL